MMNIKKTLSIVLASATIIFTGAAVLAVPSFAQSTEALPSSGEAPATEAAPGAAPAGTTGTSPKDSVCAGVELTGGSCDAPASGPTVNSILETVINILSMVVGVVAVIMVIIGGLKYITSGGDSTSTNNAKNTILYALIGLVIVALAQVIVRFVLNKVSP
jgi:hypothetical protein